MFHLSTFSDALIDTWDTWGKAGSYRLSFQGRQIARAGLGTLAVGDGRRTRHPPPSCTAQGLTGRCPAQCPGAIPCARAPGTE